MAIRQQKVPTFYFAEESDEAILAYLEKNHPLLTGHLLLFASPPNEGVAEAMLRYALTYGVAPSLPQKGSFVTQTMHPSRPTHKSAEARVVPQAIRSGERVEVSSDLIVLSNIKDGALVKTSGSLTVFGIIEGDIVCDGSFMILRPCRRGKVLFHGKEVQAELIYEGLQIVTMQQGEVLVKEIA